MQITRVTVRYGELRSSRSSFSNTRWEVELTAELEPGDDPEVSAYELRTEAKDAVKQFFGDPDAGQRELRLT